MMISRSNYEIYFVDFFDGRLDENAKAELFAFLDSNGDLKEEFEQFEMIVSTPDKKVKFANKESLKKDSPTLLNYKTWLVAELENDLSIKQVKALDEFSGKHPEIRAERKSMQSVKLVPDTVFFPGKKSLRKGGIIISFRRSTVISVSAAAAVIIFMLGYLFLNENNRNEEIITGVEKQIHVDENAVNVTEVPVIQQTVPENNSPQERIDVSKKNLANEGRKEIRPTQKNAEPLFTEEIIETPDTVSPINNILAPLEQPIAVHQESVNPEEEKTRRENITLSDILSDDDMKELNANTEVKDKTLSGIALKEVERISGVTIKKNKNAASMTYALTVKKGFSIRHTRGRE